MKIDEQDATERRQDKVKKRQRKGYQGRKRERTSAGRRRKGILGTKMEVEQEVEQGGAKESSLAARRVCRNKEATSSREPWANESSKWAVEFRRQHNVAHY